MALLLEQHREAIRLALLNQLMAKEKVTSSGSGGGAGGDGPRWFAVSRFKREDEVFFLIYSAVWIVVFGSIVSFKLYEGLGDLGYMAIGLFVATPYFLIPLLFPTKVLLDCLLACLHLTIELM